MLCSQIKSKSITNAQNDSNLSIYSITSQNLIPRKTFDRLTSKIDSIFEELGFYLSGNVLSSSNVTVTINALVKIFKNRPQHSAVIISLLTTLILNLNEGEFTNFFKANTTKNLQMQIQSLIKSLTSPSFLTDFVAMLVNIGVSKQDVIL